MAKDPKADPKTGSSAARPRRGKTDPKGGAGKGGKAAKPRRVKGQRFARWKQIVAAYKITRQRDRTLPLWMALAFFAAFAVVLLIFTLIGIPLYRPSRPPCSPACSP